MTETRMICGAPCAYGKAACARESGHWGPCAGPLFPVLDPINPTHYTAHPSGIDCITITEHMGFCLGNAVKYIWRAGLKSKDALEDLRKARWYIEREIARLEKATGK